MDDRYGRRDRLDVHNYLHSDPAALAAIDQVRAALAALTAKVDELLARPQGGGSDAALVARVVAATEKLDAANKRIEKIAPPPA